MVKPFRGASRSIGFSSPSIVRQRKPHAIRPSSIWVARFLWYLSVSGDRLTTGELSRSKVSRANRAECVPGASTPEILRLLSRGANGAILMALGDGPLRTKELTERVSGYTPRTIYRYAGRLSDLGVVDREEQPGVPSKVTHTLTDSCGFELYELVTRFADASLTRLPSGQIDAHAWASLGLLADLWETGMIEQLSCEARSPTQLSRDVSDLSYHQVNRRAGVFRSSGLLSESQGVGRSRLYGLTEKTRRKMGLIAGIGRWRHHHALTADEEGLTASEMGTVLKVALPLVSVTERRDACLQMRVLSDDEEDQVWAEVQKDGMVQSCVEAPSDPTAWGYGEIGSWVSILLDREPDGVRTEGEDDLVSDVLVGLHDVLWNPQSF